MGRVVVVGHGYVGLPVAVRAVEAGYDVVGFDLDESRVKGLAEGISFIEDISDERLGEALATGRFTPRAIPRPAPPPRPRRSGPVRTPTW